MHEAVAQWVSRCLAEHKPVAGLVLDIGGRDVNGTCRDYFGLDTEYVSLDVRPGGNVDILADAATWNPDRAYDMVLCTEVFEHTPDWRAIVATAFRALAPGGIFIATAASPGRPAHSGIDGNGLQAGEHYAGVSRWELDEALRGAGFGHFEVDEQLYPADVRCVAWREG